MMEDHVRQLIGTLYRMADDASTFALTTRYDDLAKEARGEATAYRKAAELLQETVLGTLDAESTK